MLEIYKKALSAFNFYNDKLEEIVHNIGYVPEGMRKLCKRKEMWRKYLVRMSDMYFN